MFKKIFIAIVALFVIYFILCFMGPKKWEATVTKTISGNPNLVYNQIADFKNWPKWSSWSREDITMKYNYGASTSGIGGTYSWTSEESGAGTMTFTEQILNQMVKADLKFEGLDIISENLMTLTPKGEFTDVTWSMLAKEETPFWQRGISFIMGFFYDVKNDFNKGLINLEEVVKNGGAGFAVNNYTVQEGKFNGNHYMIKRGNVKFSDLGNFFDINIKKITSFVGQNSKMPISGIIFNWNKTTQIADVAVAIPLNNKDIEKGEFEIYTIEGCKDIFSDHYGSFESTYLAYDALDSVFRSKKIEKPSLILEEYITDTNAEPDTNKWLSKVHYLMLEK